MKYKCKKLYMYVDVGVGTESVPMWFIIFLSKVYAFESFF